MKTQFDKTIPSPSTRSLRAIALCCLLTIMGSASAATLPSEPPNILVILVDDLGYGDLSSYGATDLKTPHIDGLIKSGMRFDHFYANCPVCSPESSEPMKRTIGVSLIPTRSCSQKHYGRPHTTQEL